MTGELDVTVWVDDVLPHVCTRERAREASSGDELEHNTALSRNSLFGFGVRPQPPSFGSSPGLTDLVHQSRDDGQRRPLQCSVKGVRVRDED